ncbi:MAG: Riboflavin synthase alpha chain [Geoglossum simile]|nr:MAG: Riboflavin synthase alpha chain [Geoglossum simile]
MFTGIVEAIGSESPLPRSPKSLLENVRKVKSADGNPPPPLSAVAELGDYDGDGDDSSGGGRGTSLTVSNAGEILGDAHLGDSISVNGTCLTITHFTPTTFTVGISPETLRRTTLHSLRPSTPLNLERALTPSARMGGHIVQGHVDTVAAIVSKTPDGNALTVRLQPRDQGILRYVVEKGFVALDGVSLTVTRVFDGVQGEGGGWWEVMLVAYTQEKVVITKKEVGDEVNVEVDMVGKYVEKGVRAYFEGRDGGAMAGLVERAVERVVRERLEEKEKDVR